MPGTLIIPTSLGNNAYTIRQVSSGSNVDEVLVNNVVVAITPIASLSGGILIGTGFRRRRRRYLRRRPMSRTIPCSSTTAMATRSPPAAWRSMPRVAGTNLIKVNADANDTLSDSSLTISGNSVTGTDTIALDNVNVAKLTGGPSNDTLPLNGWSGTTTITGGSGTNALVVASGTVQTSTLTVCHVQSLSVTAGTLDVNASFGSIPAVQVQSPGVLELDNGVTLTANVTNAGTLNLGNGTTTADATIAGNYTQTSAGTLDIKLGGTAAGQYDALAVTGNVSLAGTLTVTLVNNFTPIAGNSFQIITYMGALTGDFTTKNFPTLGNGNTFTTSSGNGSYTLSVIS